MTFKYPDIATQAISRILSEKRSPYNRNAAILDVQEPITRASPEVRRIIERVLQAEKDKLYMKTPRHINDDILRIVKEEVHSTTLT